MKAKSNPVGLTETTLTLPAHWAGALINGDYEGVDDTDACVINECEKLYGSCVGCSDTPEFHKYHDATADGVLAADCLTFTFIEHRSDSHGTN